MKIPKLPGHGFVILLLNTSSARALIARRLEQWTMPNTNVASGVETRKSLIRIWLAISAVWVSFWLLTATTVFAAAATLNPFIEEFGLFSAIVLTPPIALLAIGALGRFLVEALSSQVSVSEVRLQRPGRLRRNGH
jgi:hypothetical protein